MTNRLLVTAALSAGLVAGATGLSVVREGHALRGTTAPEQAVAQTALRDRHMGDPAGLSQAFRGAASSALPAVVHVQVEQFGAGANAVRRQNQQGAPRQGSGSGFVFRPDGYILTNNHVIEGADRLTVVLQDRREFTAEVVGRDPATDVAVIRINASDLPTVPLGDSDEMEVGDWVVALGYPLQLGSTATAGIVSAKGRNVNILRQNPAASNAALENFIQTDAAINPGNSGGPLIDLEGRAIGINSAIASPTGFFSGYGFAVPINIGRRVADDLIQFGEVHRPRLGVEIADVDPADAEVYKLESVSGAEIRKVLPGEAAARAGIQLGDVVVSVEDRSVSSSGELMERLALYAPGQRVRLGLVRYGKKLDVTVQLGQFEPGARADARRQPERRTGTARLGFAAADLTPELAERLGMNAGRGVVVTDVDPTTGVVRAGLVPQMIIERVNGQSVRSLQDLERLVGSLEPGATVSILALDRDGMQTIVNFRVRG